MFMPQEKFVDEIIRGSPGSKIQYSVYENVVSFIGEHLFLVSWNLNNPNSVEKEMIYINSRWGLKVCSSTAFFSKWKLSPYWKNLVDAIAVAGVGFKAPNDDEIKGPILSEKMVDVGSFIEEQREIMKKKGCTIMCDGWMNSRNKTLLNFLVSSSGGTVFLKSIDVSGKVKNAEYLCGILEEVVAEVGEGNVVQVITDSAGNYIAAGRLLMERHPSIFWTPCSAYCLDLILEDLENISWVKPIVEHARNICKYIYNNAWVLDLMRKYTEKEELVRPGITRSATTFITLQSLLQSKAALQRMFLSEDWSKKTLYSRTNAGIDIVEWIFDDRGFWIPAKEIVKVTEPLVSLLYVAAKEKPSMGYVYEGMNRVTEAIRALCGSIDSKFRSIWEIIDQRWQHQLYKPLHAAGYFLNPTFQFRSDFKADEEVLSGLYTVIEKIEADPQLRATIMSEIEIFRLAQGDLFAREICKTTRTTLQPNAWWEMFGAKVPNLQKIAIRVLSQPSSASGCEHNWSMFEHIHSKKCNRLIGQRLNDLVYIHYNLRLRHKQIMGFDLSPITLEEVDPHSEWITEIEEPVFTKEDHTWIDQAELELEAAAIVEDEKRTRVNHMDVTSTRAGSMAAVASRTYAKRSCRGHHGATDVDVGLSDTSSS